ncbi:MAG TPA: hydroxyisourate hydrolase [Bacteroidales bacterium]|nr:hydroxyisourate hydrolase [Bacteroidales bacterium]
MKHLTFTLAFILTFTIAFAQAQNHQLSSHILDITTGQPARDVSIRLEKLNEQTNIWSFVDEKRTDKNGRINDFLSTENANQGIYKLIFLTSDYFKKNDIKTFYPFIEVVFEISDTNHYHVPITLSAFGYSTYRGN